MIVYKDFSELSIQTYYTQLCFRINVVVNFNSQIHLNNFWLGTNTMRKMFESELLRCEEQMVQLKI